MQDEKEGVPDLGVLKNVMAHNWVEPSKRERKRVPNYSEAEYYRQVGSMTFCFTSVHRR